ncbi:RNA polymerase sigma factor [Salirhabdus euzebyi]|uniref:RNA polymerase sigma factor SigI n=1 Tax=Salirhabdus euzebyi TaxID=394506 RepID=A0A841Q1Q9_9BACI|nr:RNA polymerase sigma-I factor [Salirhabdus euzebyi]MBB6451825.1 RNA polymerase sigma factor [Salirhabdus euzebyi]
MIERLMRKKQKLSLEDQVLLAQNGDSGMRNQLLKQYQPFIAKSVSEVCKKFIDPKQDDEFSIGLIAFNRAIDSYSDEKGSSFLSFAKLVVKRKVIDYLRSENNKGIHISINQTNEDDDQLENPQEVKIAKEKYEQSTEEWLRKEEIIEYSKQLIDYKITFQELTKVSPKHVDARESAILVAKTIYKEAELRAYVEEKKRLPMKELVQYVDVSRKTLERNRKYILAIFIILCGDYVFLKEYIKGVDL